MVRLVCAEPGRSLLVSAKPGGLQLICAQPGVFSLAPPKDWLMRSEAPVGQRRRRIILYYQILQEISRHCLPGDVSHREPNPTAGLPAGTRID
jgi:hypothetical protein